MHGLIVVLTSENERQMGFVLIIDRRSDRWMAVKSLMTYIEVSDRPLHLEVPWESAGKSTKFHPHLLQTEWHRISPAQFALFVSNLGVFSVLHSMHLSPSTEFLDATCIISNHNLE